MLRELICTTEPWRRFIYNGLRAFIANAKIGQIYQLPDNWQLLKDRKQFILNKIKVQKKKPIAVADVIFRVTKLSRKQRHGMIWC